MAFGLREPGHQLAKRHRLADGYRLDGRQHLAKGRRRDRRHRLAERQRHRSDKSATSKQVRHE
jgi:hypothetical protein